MKLKPLLNSQIFWEEPWEINEKNFWSRAARNGPLLYELAANNVLFCDLNPQQNLVEQSALILQGT